MCILQTLETIWTCLDPLTISNTTVSIYKQFSGLYCREACHHTNCICYRITFHYGNQPFTCPFLNCSHYRSGFASQRLRDSHIKNHDRPWHCEFSGCEFAAGGFLSRKMRDDHLSQFHQDRGDTQSLLALDRQGVQQDELIPLLYDLIRLDNLDAVKALVERFQKLDNLDRENLFNVAAFSGSLSMLRLLLDKQRYYRADLLQLSIRGQNVEVMKWLISLDLDPIDDLFRNVLRSDSEEIRAVWKAAYTESQQGKTKQWKENQRKNHRPHFISAQAIIAVGGDPFREDWLISHWKEIEVFNKRETDWIGHALVNVASSTCSLKIARYILQFSSNVDHRRSAKYPTPLHHAATKTTAEAAELMKLLLIEGADPNKTSGGFDRRDKVTEIRRIQDEKGAKGISKWLGISWDELVAQTKKERGEIVDKERQSDQMGNLQDINEIEDWDPTQEVMEILDKVEDESIFTLAYEEGKSK
jgi:hypothetical protein